MMREQLEGMELSWPSATTMHTPSRQQRVSASSDFSFARVVHLQVPLEAEPRQLHTLIAIMTYKKHSEPQQLYTLIAIMKDKKTL